MKELKSYAEIVYLEVREKEIEKAPPPVYTKYGDPTMGITVPVVIVTDPSSGEVWGGISYKQMSKDSFRTLEKDVKGRLENWDAAEQATALPDVSLNWMLETRRHYKGKFDSVEGDQLNLLVDGGRKASFDLSRFAPPVQEYAKELARRKNEVERKKILADKMPKLDSETWTSTDGKPLQATFVKLDGGEITVKSDAGKVFTFPLERLDDAGKARAKALGAQIADALKAVEMAAN